MIAPFSSLKTERRKPFFQHLLLKKGFKKVKIGMVYDSIMMLKNSDYIFSL